MASFSDLSNELLHNILLHATPSDLAHLSQCCRSLYSFINNNELLWKDLYLSLFDDPRQQRPEPPTSWQAELSRLWKLHTLLASTDGNVKRSNFCFIASTLVDFLATSAPTPDSSSRTFLRHHFTNRKNMNAILCGSSLFEEGGNDDQVPLPTERERHMSARLHVLHGVPRVTERRRNPINTYARSRVYDLRRYTEHTRWGPFLPDGSMRVDWENLESIMVVIAHNMQRFSERTYGRFRPIWDVPFAGVASKSFRSKPSWKSVDNDPDVLITPNTPTVSTDVSRTQRTDSLLTEPAPSLEEQDPYGVTGTWARIVCFLDFLDLYNFNFNNENDPIPDDQPREPIAIEEAIRFIAINLKIRKIEPPGPNDGQALPVVHFTGSSRSMHSPFDLNANSKIRGTARLTPEGAIRWTTFSIFDGEERWRSECVQIGGIRSARGMLGTWFEKDYSHDGPAGPTAFWKISDEPLTGTDETHLIPLET